MYNKTALNKIKKADLIALFLEQQAEKNQLVLDSDEHEKLKAHMIYMGQNKMKADLKKLKQENEKLKKRIEEDHKAVPTFRIQDMYRDVKEENEKLKEENEKLKWDCEQMGKSPWVGTPACDKMLKLIEENKKLNQQNDYAYKQINELTSKINLSTI